MFDWYVRDFMISQQVSMWGPTVSKNSRNEWHGGCICLFAMNKMLPPGSKLAGGAWHFVHCDALRWVVLTSSDLFRSTAGIMTIWECAWSLCSRHYAWWTCVVGAHFVSKDGVVVWLGDCQNEEPMASCHVGDDCRMGPIFWAYILKPECIFGTVDWFWSCGWRVIIIRK